MDAHGDGACVHVTCFSKWRNFFLKKMRREPRGAHRMFLKNKFIRFEMVYFMAKSECTTGTKLFFEKMRRAPRGAHRILLNKQIFNLKQMRRVRFRIFRGAVQPLRMGALWEFLWEWAVTPPLV